MKGRCIQKENSFVWLVKAPFRLLVNARDAYIRIITSCSRAGILTGGGSTGFSQRAGNFQICDPPSTVLPRSFTLTSTVHDQGCMIGDGPTTGMRQSVPLGNRRNDRCVVVMGRINEEISCDDEYEEEDCFLDYEVKKKKMPRTMPLSDSDTFPSFHKTPEGRRS